MDLSNLFISMGVGSYMELFQNVIEDHLFVEQPWLKQVFYKLDGMVTDSSLCNFTRFQMSSFLMRFY